MKVFKNINQLLTLEKAHQKDGRNLQPEDLSIIEDATLVFDSEDILWVGQTSEIPSEYKSLPAQDLSGFCVTPEIVDNHTHLVFGGNRSHEYSLRLNGADYQEIAKAGGGILETVRGTNASSEKELFELGKERIERLYSLGIGTIEIKSGYSLNYEAEYRLSKVINDLKNYFNPKVQIIRTYMAAHAIPKNFDSGEDYLNAVVIPLMIQLHSEKLIDHVDIFFEQGYFNKQDTVLLFNKAKELNLPVKLHADEFNDNKGAILGCEYNALSVDHLLCTTEDGIKKLNESKTVANFLPGTGLFLGKPLAQARKFLDNGVKVSLGSDYNPGSCHVDNLILIASIAAPLLKLNQAELWSSITLNAAHSLGLYNQGAIIKGNQPRFSFFKCDSLNEITYSWGKNLAVNADILLN